MASRAFAALLISESGALKSREIADVLDVSPAAVSGAVKYLEQAKLVRRTRLAGERIDRFVLGDDAWYTAMTMRNEIFVELNRALERGIESLPESSGAFARLEETRDFFTYIQREMPKMVERWHQSR
ncbi:MAG: MarR family transcriptional regulator [Actinomycetota bacterium]|nr:MarR family transcriptional regulator [Actinomycetota bacterium]